MAPTKNAPVKCDKLINSSSKQNKLLHREFYKLSNDIYAAIIRKVFLNEF